jgi:hypothetical protein
MNWLLAPIIPRRQWPAVRFGQKRAITLEEHQKIVAGESNAELRDFYELLWHLGGSQTNIATLCADNFDWANRTMAYRRRKNQNPALVRLGDTVERRRGLGRPHFTCWKKPWQMDAEASRFWLTTVAASFQRTFPVREAIRGCCGSTKRGCDARARSAPHA